MSPSQAQPCGKTQFWLNYTFREMLKKMLKMHQETLACVDNTAKCLSRWSDVNQVRQVHVGPECIQQAKFTVAAANRADGTVSTVASEEAEPFLCGVLHGHAAFLLSQEADIHFHSTGCSKGSP